MLNPTFDSNPVKTYPCLTVNLLSEHDKKCREKAVTELITRLIDVLSKINSP